MSKAVQQLFSSIAPKYDFLNHFMSLSIDRRWREKTLASLKGRDWDSILDLCSGTLDLTERLSQIFPSSHVVAVDFSLAMLEHGRHKLKGADLCHCVCADGHTLPFPEDSFDAVVCAFGIRNLERRSQALGEIRRVLRKNGRLVVLEFFRPEKVFSKLFYQTYGKFVIPQIGGVISKNRQAYEYLQRSIGEFFSVEEYVEFLNQHGFKKITTTPLSGGIAHRVTAEL
jgi:demethylmenaquinone methyltransferase/2-methoxy-6-polyprenyl-1,4-benzoquinol methylase